jgi:hypothetical protein
MNLNEVTYGNPTNKQYRHITKRCMVDTLFDKLKENRFPDNNSEMVKDELNELVDYLSVMDNEDNETYEINDITEIGSFSESVNFIIKCKTIEQLEQLQTKLN